MAHRSFLLGLMATTALCAGGALAADKIKTTGEGALVIASRLVDEGKLGEAEAILRTLSAANPDDFDMRPVDALAAKIAYKRGDKEEALRILEAMVAYDPADWRRQNDLIQLLIQEKRDREARRHIRAMLKQNPPDVVATQAKSDMRMLEARRVVHVDFRAAAAPTTNVNSATSDETFNLFGFLPAQLDDEARQQSGLGVTYALSGAVTPKIGEGVRGHFAVRGEVADYGNIEFDQATLAAELGVRLGSENGVTGVIAATADRRYFAGDPYAASFGGRLALQRAMNKRVLLAGEVAARHVTYDEQPDRDGPVFLAGTQVTVAAAKRLRLSGGVAAIREAAKAESLANTQFAVNLGALVALPYRINLGIRPEVTFRRFDKATQFYGGERREDVTYDLTTSLSIRDFAVRGFAPSLSYRYTDNESTISLFDYDRHAVDVGLAKSF